MTDVPAAEHLQQPPRLPGWVSWGKLTAGTRVFRKSGRRILPRINRGASGVRNIIPLKSG